MRRRKPGNGITKIASKMATVDQKSEPAAKTATSKMINSVHVARGGLQPRESSRCRPLRTVPDDLIERGDDDCNHAQENHNPEYALLA